MNMKRKIILSPKNNSNNIITHSLSDLLPLKTSPDITQPTKKKIISKSLLSSVPVNQRLASVYLTLSLLSGLSIGITPSSLVFFSVFSISSSIMSLAYMKNYGKIFGKNHEGKTNKINVLLLLPIYSLQWIALGIYSLSAKQAYHKISDKLLLGRRLFNHEAKKTIDKENIVATLDLTAEFPECNALRKGTVYKNIPILDKQPPSLAELLEGVLFIDSHIKKGSIYIHCAAGNERSATFVAAYLMFKGLANNVSEVELYMQKKRNTVKLTPSQKQGLVLFQKNLPNLF